MIYRGPLTDEEKKQKVLDNNWSIDPDNPKQYVLVEPKSEKLIIVKNIKGCDKYNPKFEIDWETTYCKRNCFSALYCVMNDCR